MTREFLKAICNATAVLAAAPLAAWFFVISKAIPGRREATFQGCTQLLAIVPGLPGEYLRRAFLWLTAARCALSSSIGFGSIFASPDVIIEERVYIGPYCSIGHVVIRCDTMLGTGVHLLGGGHAHTTDRLDIPMRLQGGTVEFIEVSEDCWIGNGAIVMAKIGAHTIIGAGAVVTRPIPEWSVAAGSPARIVRDRRLGVSDDQGEKVARGHSGSTPVPGSTIPTQGLGR